MWQKQTNISCLRGRSPERIGHLTPIDPYYDRSDSKPGRCGSITWLDVISGILDNNDRIYTVMRTVSTRVAHGNEDNLGRVSTGVIALERCGQGEPQGRVQCPGALLPPHCEEARRGHEEEEAGDRAGWAEGGHLARGRAFC